MAGHIVVLQKVRQSGSNTSHYLIVLYMRFSTERAWIDLTSFKKGMKLLW